MILSRGNACRLGLLLLAGLSAACQTRPSVTLDVPVASKYMFRGAVLNEDPVVQPDLYLTAKDDEQSLTLGVFGSLDTTDVADNQGNFTEVDFHVDYTRTVGPLSLSLGAARYEYPHTGSTGSTEAYLIAAVQDLPVTPALELWYDIDEIDGSYLNFNLSRGFELGEEWSLDAVAGVGFMSAPQAASSYGIEHDGLSDALLQLTLGHSLGESVSLSLTAAYARVLDADFRAAVEHPDNAFGAVGVSFGF